MYSIKALLTTILFLLLQPALADLDSNVRASSCQSCLQSVELTCSGPTNSQRYSDCFCDLNGKSWMYLVECITSHDTNCDQDQDLILNNYGGQCFLNNVQNESKLCGHITGHSEQLLYLIKRYCRDVGQPGYGTTSGTAVTPIPTPSSTPGGRSSTPSGAASTPWGTPGTPGTPTSSPPGSGTTYPSSAGSGSGTTATTSTKTGSAPCLRGGEAMGVGIAGLAAALV